MFAYKTYLSLLGGVALFSGAAMAEPAAVRITGKASLAPIAERHSFFRYVLRAELHRRDLSTDDSRYRMTGHLTTNGKRADAALVCGPPTIDLFIDSFEQGANP